MKTLKFGGSSLADGKRIRHCADLVGCRTDVNAVIVSAPGRVFPCDTKITDTLLNACRDCERREESILAVISRFREICRYLAFDIDIDAGAFASCDGDNDAYIISRGEYYCAKIMAKLLGARFVDAFDAVKLCPDGTIDVQGSFAAIKAAAEDARGPIVVPGFYGECGGKVMLMERGGSDITGALVAAALSSEVYENWTDTDGIMTADPRIVSEARGIAAMSFPELELLTELGASVLHPSSVAPAREHGIAINVRNTFAPETPGTVISGEAPGEKPVAVTARHGFSPCALGSVRDIGGLLSCFGNGGSSLVSAVGCDDEAAAAFFAAISRLCTGNRYYFENERTVCASVSEKDTHLALRYAHAALFREN